MTAERFHLGDAAQRRHERRAARAVRSMKLLGGCWRPKC